MIYRVLSMLQRRFIEELRRRLTTKVIETTAFPPFSIVSAASRIELISPYSTCCESLLLAFDSAERVPKLSLETKADG
jgi:hypothetical protein